MLYNKYLKPDIEKHPLDCLHHLYDARLINYRAIQTPYKGVNDLAAGERLGRKFTCAPFIPHGRGLKNKSTNSWEKYRTQRNFVTKLKKKSESVYFSERCVGGSKSTDFWSTINHISQKRQ